MRIRGSLFLGSFFVFVYFIGCIAGCVGAYFLRENYAKSTRIASPSDFRTSFSRAHDSSKLSSCSCLESLRASRQKREKRKIAKTRRKSRKRYMRSKSPETIIRNVSKALYTNSFYDDLRILLFQIQNHLNDLFPQFRCVLHSHIPDHQ